MKRILTLFCALLFNISLIAKAGQVFFGPELMLHYTETEKMTMKGASGFIEFKYSLLSDKEEQAFPKDFLNSRLGFGISRGNNSEYALQMRSAFEVGKKFGIGIYPILSIYSDMFKRNPLSLPLKVFVSPFELLHVSVGPDLLKPQNISLTFMTSFNY